jgi:hypothetical protein
VARRACGNSSSTSGAGANTHFSVNPPLPTIPRVRACDAHSG